MLKTKTLNFAEQKIGLLKFPNTKKCEVLNQFGQIKKRTLVWSGELKPSDISRNYLVKMVFVQGDYPKVFVIKPRLKKRGDVKPPHLHNWDECQLCLFYPKFKEWTSKSSIADTIIPWTSEWLYFYECWLISGKWNGGGKEH